MTFPIQHVLSWPDRCEPCASSLDFTRIHRLELRPPDPDKFPCLRLATEALRQGGIAPAVYNSANQAAVEAFLDNQLHFLAIPRLIGQCLEAASFAEPATLEDLLALETELLEFARAQLKELKN